MKQKFNSSVLLVSLTFVIWGIFPIYFKLLSHILPFEVIAQRAIWTCILMLIVVICIKKIRLLKQVLSDKVILLKILLSSIFIGGDWVLYNYAVVTDRVLETSLGYFSGPIITIFFGLVFFKEKLGSAKKIAICLTIIALSIKVILLHNISWISIGLALLFSLYGLVKKTIKINPIILFFVESVIISIPASIFCMYLFKNEQSYFNGGWDLPTTLLLMGLGLMTAVPLLLFNHSVRRVELSIIGFIQYITPSISFLLGILVFKETFAFLDFLVFLLIWISIVLVTIENVIKKKSTILSSPEIM